ncbi:hypothetical protein HDU76_003301 [Blyttiomyces sp. JEL0837]|nr:hypothetical protein HDU76_003301 [Blyttiomyces sp. JEL0837]
MTGLASLLALLASSTSAALAAKSASSINVGIVLPYALRAGASNSTTLQEISLNVQANDAAAELAVIDVNSDPTILPNTNVNIVRINNWDPRYTTDPAYQLIDSGGYSGIQVNAAVNANKTVVMFGDYFDNTTSFTAEVLSYLKVPICGATQTDPTLSDKANYPLFFRTNPAYQIGNHLSKLLTAWNVTRVSVIVATDSISSAYGDDISLSLSSSNINVSTKVILTPEMQAQQDYSYSLGILSTWDSRYFVIAADANLTADFYYAAKGAGLVGNDYVWIGVNPPYVGSDDTQKKLYGGGALWDMRGFIWIKNNFPGTTSVLYQNFWKRWQSLNSQNSTKYPIINGELPVFVRQSYDCMRLLLAGVWKALSNATDPTSLLSNPSNFRSPGVLPLTMFTNTGYDGLLSKQLTIDPNSGDMITSMLFVSLNQTIIDLSDVAIDSTVAFAQTPVDASVITFTKSPVFYSGNSIPPNDGSIPIIPTERVIGDPSTIAALLVAAEAIGLLFAGLFLMHVIYEAATSRPTHPLVFSFCVISGCILVFVSMKTWAGRESVQTCQVQRFLLPTGFALSYGAIFAKLHHLSQSIQNRHEVARGVGVIWVLSAVSPFVVVNIILAAIWMTVGDPFVQYVSVSKYEFIYSCSTNNKAAGDYLTYGFYVVDGLLGLGCAYLSNQLKKQPDVKIVDILCKIALLAGVTMIAIPFLSPETVLPRILRAFVAWIIALATLIVYFAPPLVTQFMGGKKSTDTDFDFNMIKSGINRESSTNWDSGNLEVLNLGTVYYQTRGLFGWSQKKKADMILHRRRGQSTVTFPEVNGPSVQAFNLSNLLNDGTSLRFSSAASEEHSQGGSQSGATESLGGAGNASVDSLAGSKEVVLITRRFSVRVIAVNPAHAIEIRAQIFGAGGAPGASGTLGTAASGSESAAGKKGGASQTDAGKVTKSSQMG